MKQYRMHLYDAGLLFTGTVLFAGCVSARLATGHNGWMIPVAAYTYTHGDFFFDAFLSAMLAMTVLVLAERIGWVCRSQSRRAGVFAVATMVSLYCGPPSPVLFGNTWTSAEIATTFFIAHMDLVLPIVLLSVCLRAVVLRRNVIAIPDRY